MDDADLASAVADAYVAPPTFEVAGDVRLVIVGDTILIPGTRPDVMADWLRDIDVLPNLARGHRALGLCHQGCIEGAEAALPMIPPGDWTIAGHSLGGGIAVLLAALLTIDGRPPRRLVTFGAMRCFVGSGVLATLAPVPGPNYCRRGDRVPDLPPLFRLWRAPLMVGVSSLDFIADHSIEGYAAEVRALLSNQSQPEN